MIFKLALKNIFSRKSSLVIVLFMSFAAALLVVSNAILDSTEQGIEASFIDSFTGDFIIRPVSNVPLSLFGDETPAVGQLTEIGRLIPYQEIIHVLENDSKIKSFIPMVSGLVAIEANGVRELINLFGVNAIDYVNTMPGLIVEVGNPYEIGEKGVMLPKRIAEKLQVSVGDEVQFTITDGTSFRIRASTVTGIISYKVDNVIFDKFILLNPETTRSLMGVTNTFANTDSIEDENLNLLEDEINLDDLFFMEDVTEKESEKITLEDIFTEESDTLQLPEENLSTSWNYLICRVQNDENVTSVIKRYNNFFEENTWPIEAAGWREAAGSTATYLYWLRVIINTGILIVVLSGLIMVNNTLTINVLDRIREIGTMRAFGASKTFISIQCMIETLSLTLVSGVFGCILGWILSWGITKAHIVFTNSFLIQLFGNSALETIVTPTNIIGIFVLMILLGLIGWIYPVINVVKINPVEAIQGGK